MCDGVTDEVFFGVEFSPAFPHGAWIEGYLAGEVVPIEGDFADEKFVTD